MLNIVCIREWHFGKRVAVQFVRILTFLHPPRESIPRIYFLNTSLLEFYQVERSFFLGGVDV